MSSNIDNAILQLNEYTKDNKINRSEEREIILRCIDSMDSHFSVSSLLKKVCENDHVSRATIYNTISLFLKAGLILRHPFNNSVDEYEATWRSALHHHRICTQCGIVREFTDKKIQTPIKNRYFNAFDKTFSSVYLYGLCKKCTKKKKVVKRKVPKAVSKEHGVDKKT